MPEQNNRFPYIKDDAIIDNFIYLVNQAAAENTSRRMRDIITKIEKATDPARKFLLKCFLFNREIGMLNADETRNISFRVDTINMIFDSIYDYCADHTLSKDNLNGDLDAMFFAAGKQCGQRFGESASFQDHLKRQAPKNHEDKINKWCEFDSDAGWGTLSYDAEADVLTIKNNFQLERNAAAATDAPPKNCTFFQGYVTGVLEKLLRKETVTVTCKHTRCDCVHSKNGACDCQLHLDWKGKNE